MKTEFNEWEFIEANLPDYSSNEDVALSDDLAKYIDYKCPHCFFVVAEAESPPLRCDTRLGAVIRPTATRPTNTIQTPTTPALRPARREQGCNGY